MKDHSVAFQIDVNSSSRSSTFVSICCLCITEEECQENSCMNEGVCVVESGIDTCKCPENTAGSFCESKMLSLVYL